MKTKNIFKTLAAAMLMPAMLLNTACNKEIETENTAGKGYTLPVTVNVTRQADDPASKATFNESTRKLEFSEGDKLFVQGGHDTAGDFAGTLDYDTATGKFRGTISTQNEYTGTADAFFSSAAIKATLLPAGYESYGYLFIDGNGTGEVLYDDYIDFDDNKAIAESKAAGVAQFSLEQAWEYNDGIPLEPQNAILNFTITGLTASTEVDVEFSNGSVTISGSVATDGDGTATFAMGVIDGTGLNSFVLTVGGNDITLVSESKTLAAGKIYNINRSALTYPIALSEVTSAYKGSVVTTDSNVYATVADAIAASKTAVAMIAYVGSETGHATYKHGLAIALADEGAKNWNDAKTACEGKAEVTGAAWLLPSQNQWNAMFNANNNYQGLNTAITTAGGTALQESVNNYWSSTETYSGSMNAYNVLLRNGLASWASRSKGNGYLVRACLAF